MSDQEKKRPPKDEKSIDLNGLKKDEKRVKDRALIASSVLIYNLLFGNKTYKGTIKNISPGGVCFEVTKADFIVGAQAMIEFGTSPTLNIGTIKCTLQWIKSAEGQPNLQLLGFKYSDDISESKKKKIESYLSSILKDVWG